MDAFALQLKISGGLYVLVLNANSTPTLYIFSALLL